MYYGNSSVLRIHSLMRVHPKRDRGLHAEDVPQRGRALLLEGHPAAHHGRDPQARMEVLHLRAVQGPLQVLQGPGKDSLSLPVYHTEVIRLKSFQRQGQWVGPKAVQAAPGACPPYRVNRQVRANLQLTETLDVPPF